MHYYKQQSDIQLNCKLYPTIIRKSLTITNSLRKLEQTCFTQTAMLTSMNICHCA